MSFPVLRREKRAMMKPSSSLSSPLFFFFFFFLSSLSLSLLLPCIHAQQDYVANKQLDCYGTNSSSTLGYSCNGAQPSCSSYLIFRSQPPYQTPVQIGYLLASVPSEIAQINGVTDVDTIPTNTLVIVPVNCSCSGKHYQHNTSYTLKYTGETYLLTANDTYQGLSTCQALLDQNPYDSTNLIAKLKVSVPIRCACPTRNQTVSSGVKYLLTYLITFGDTVEAVAQRFGVDTQSVLEANGLSSASTIYPFTTLLVPLKSEPTKAETVTPPPPPPPPPSPSPASPDVPAEGGGPDDKTWVYAGIGIGVGFLAICGLLLLAWFVYRRRGGRRPFPEGKKKLAESVEYGGLSEMESSSFTKEVHGVLDSLTLYKFEELERVTGFFGEDHRISGSVYRGVIGGDEAAIKRRKGDVSGEITILKQINHANVIRLSGFCLHEGNSYLVYELAENGSLSDWIHHGGKEWSASSCLSWKQRVRIAYDVADGLNYLHNYTNPPYVHKDLKSSNILLDGEFRAKVGNFGMARSVENTQGLQLTRHVVGTQGYMAPEYLEHGLVTPKLDVFAFGVVLLELLSGKEAILLPPYGSAAAAKGDGGDGKGGSLLLSAWIGGVLGGENVRDKLRRFVDPCLRDEYPFDLVFAISQLAMRCVEQDPSSRPNMAELFVSLSAIYSTSLDWDPSSEIPDSGSVMVGF